VEHVDQRGAQQVQREELPETKKVAMLMMYISDVTSSSQKPTRPMHASK